MSTPRLSLHDGTTERGSKRQKRVDIMKKFTDEGWAIIEKGKKLYKMGKNDQDLQYPIHRVKNSDSKYDIFMRLMPHSLIMEIFNNRIEERNGGLTFDKGKGNYYTIEKSIFIPLYIFAVKIFIQGNQNMTLKKDQALKDAVKKLKTKAPHIPCASMMNKLMGMFFIDYKGEETKKLSENMSNLFRSFGDMISGDEKLFYFTGKSGYVRKVVSKPGSIGLWMYQACVSLKCGLPCLVYSRMHTSNKQSGTVVKCHDIIKECGNMIETSCTQDTTLFMDSYYLQEESRAWLKEKGINYIASIHSGRFGALVKVLQKQVKNTGSYVQCFNQATRESAVCYYSNNKNLGKKTVIGLGFEVKKETEKDMIVPMYDHYGVGFSNCDKFNKALHGKTWPYKVQGDQRAHSNYIFTCILINTYHLWKDSGNKDEDRNTVSWQKFCLELAYEMIE